MIKINKNIIERKKFPDGTFVIKDECFPKIANTKAVVFEWKYECEEESMFLFYLVKHMRKLIDDKSVNFMLYLPYIPNARMDRVKSESEVFTLKYFCEFINMLGFDKVYVMDAHSNVALALIDRVVSLNLELMISTAINDFEPDVIFFPDEGSCKRYSEIISTFTVDGKTSYPVAYANKKRDWDTGKILGLEIVNKEAVEGKKVLIIDDICSRGGTFYFSAKALKECGAGDIALYITHCENTILDGDLIKSDYLKKIYTTDSICTIKHPLIVKRSL